MKRSLVVLVAVGCGKSSPPPSSGSSAAPPPAPVAGGNSTSCANVVVKIEAMRNAPSGSLDELVAQCDAGWSEGYRKCMLAIASRDEIPTCDREALIARGVDMGGPECEQVMQHFADVEKMPADVYAKTKTKLLATCSALPRSVKECALSATDHAGLAACASANTNAAR
ncbi:MAG TPA: hypothetical protein VGM90_27530 [Kofleriaceae bacterium]|jgi:hypothetical protein